MIENKKINSDTYRPIPFKISCYFTDETASLLSNALMFKQVPLLIGDSGTGKSSLIKSFAQSKGVKVIRIDGSSSLTEDEIVGCFAPSEGKDGRMNISWKDGFLTRAVREGYWLIIEEINGIKSSAKLAFHSLMEPTGFLTIPQTGEVIYKHPDFNLIFTKNPHTALYAGTQKENFAFEDRCIPIPISYLKKSSEVSLIMEHFGYGEDYYAYNKILEVVEILCSFVETQRAQFSDGTEYEFPLTTRKLIQWIQQGHCLPLTITYDLFMRGLTDDITSQSYSEAILALIPEGGELDLAFMTLGKHIPTKNLSDLIDGMISSALYKKQIDKGVHEFPSSALRDMGKKIDYFKLAYNYSYTEVCSDELLSQFDTECVEVARNFLLSKDMM